MTEFLTGLACAAASIGAAYAVATAPDRDPLARLGDDPHDWSTHR